MNALIVKKTLWRRLISEMRSRSVAGSITAPAKEAYCRNELDSRRTSVVPVSGVIEYLLGWRRIDSPESIIALAELKMVLAPYATFWSMPQY